MSDATNDWARYAAVTYLASHLGRGERFGKKALQKVIYLLQECKGIDLGIPYTFYTYGVFSSELASTVEVLQNIDGLNVEYLASENAYYISAGALADEIISRGKEFLDSYKQEFEEMIAFAKGKTGKCLELISTIIFVANSPEFAGNGNNDEIVERVHELKPKFDKQTIHAEFAELLRDGGFLGTQNVRAKAN